MIPTPDQEQIIESMRKRLADNFGVTVVGDRVTVRWSEPDTQLENWHDQPGRTQLVDVHMVILDATSLAEARDRSKVRARYQKLFEKYPGLEAELYFADEGEWPK